MTTADIRAGTSANSSQGLAARWRILTLAQQFLVMGGLVVMAGMLVIGLWVSRQIEDGVTRNTAIATALYVDNFISPLIGELEHEDVLSSTSIRALDAVLKDGPISTRLVSVKIWNTDGTIVYGTDGDLIGRKFPPREKLELAAKGLVQAGLDDLHDEEDVRERQSNLPILEIYSPIHSIQSGRTIAVAEFYEDGTDLKKTLADARLRSWLMVALTMTAMAGLLMIIVYRGSKTIDQQQATLHSQLEEVTATSEQNQTLRRRVQQASERLAELNERFLKRTSAELHDGPSQLLSFAALRLGEARKIADEKDREDEFDKIEKALEDAVLEIRNVCKGLSLPDIDKLSVQQIIERVAHSHTVRTKAVVGLETPESEIGAPKATKICIYRFVQEALNNSWKHAHGSQNQIMCAFDEKAHLLSVSICDDGPGFDLSAVESKIDKLGLQGLRERVRSIGGELHIDSDPGSGTTLVLEVDLSSNARLLEERT